MVLAADPWIAHGRGGRFEGADRIAVAGRERMRTLVDEAGRFSRRAGQLAALSVADHERVPRCLLGSQILIDHSTSMASANGWALVAG